MERLNKEIRHRTAVASTFSSGAAARCLVEAMQVNSPTSRLKGALADNLDIETIPPRITFVAESQRSYNPER